MAECYKLKLKLIPKCLDKHGILAYTKKKSILDKTRNI